MAKLTQERVRAALVTALSEGRILHLKAEPQPAARKCYPNLPAVDATVGPYPQTGGWSLEDYSPRRWRDGRGRVREGRRNEREEFRTAEHAAKRVMVDLLGGRLEPAVEALRRTYGDPTTEETREERRAANAAWAVEVARTAAAADIQRRISRDW